MVLGRPLGYSPHPLGQDGAWCHNGGLLLLRRLLTRVLDDGDLAVSKAYNQDQLTAVYSQHTKEDGNRFFVVVFNMYVLVIFYLHVVKVSLVRILRLGNSDGKVLP